jgi:hypothetical protein
MGNVFNDFVVDMLCELHRSLCPARGAYSTALARKGDKERVLTAVAVNPSGAVGEDAAIEILVEGFHHLIP